MFWAFVILGTVYLEAYVILLTRDPEWNWFVFGNWAVLGFIQDFIAVMAVVGIAVFWGIRLRNQPKQLGRKSRFFGSHLGPAYFTLFMIFNVVWTLFLFRGAVEARDMGTGRGYGKAAFVSYLLGKVLPDSTALIGIGLILHIGVMLVFLNFVLNSKHLHIFVAPLNVLFGRRPVALGAVKPLISNGKPVTLDDIEDLDEDAALGVGAITDFSWKGLLDFTTCTECGRCQSQCPAWNTEKPLSPKLLIMNLRDHALAAAPADASRATATAPRPRSRSSSVPLIADEAAYGVIDPDVLWSCTTCGACVNQCPVDIEHVDHIVDMRRYQVLVESNFPGELNQLFRGPGGQGQPLEHVGPGPDGLGQGSRLRGARRRRDARVAGVGRLAVLGRLRRRLRGPREEDDPCGRRAAQPRRHLLRRPRQRRDLHRRPGAPRGQRVRLPGARRAEHRDLHGAPGQAGRHDVRPLLQHAQERVPRPRPRARGRPPHPAAEPARP